jgi:hypothetical protein
LGIHVQCNQFNSCPGWQLIDNNSKSAQIESGGGQLIKCGKTAPFGATPEMRVKTAIAWLATVDNNSTTIEIVASGTICFSDIRMELYEIPGHRVREIPAPAGK